MANKNYLTDPPPTKCNHVWEHCWSINNVAVDAKYIDGDYLVWCPTCGSIGRAPCRGRGLEQHRVTIDHLAYEDPHRGLLTRRVLTNRGEAMDAGVKV